MQKTSGILCHFTSLPSTFGVGDFGPISYKWIDYLSESGQAYWQVLPIGNTDDSGCPYATDSAFGIADFFISPELLIKKFNLESNAFDEYKFESTTVDFKKVKKNKENILKSVFEHFVPNLEFDVFLNQEESWIEDYALYRTLRDSRGIDWKSWPLASKSKECLTEEEKNLFIYHQFVQFLLCDQLNELHLYAKSKNVQLIGDLPIFVSYYSMDVWRSPSEFYLDENLEMKFETGAAPDFFSQDGQKWGTPIYHFENQKSNQYSFWKKRVDYLSRYFDVVRIDHFRGFCATWISDVNEETAINGFWYKGPGAELFLELFKNPKLCSIIAEDLGVITEDVEKLRDQFNFPGMRVLQFMLGDETNPHQFNNHVYNSFSYSGTHDCDTLVGWWNSLGETDKASVAQELDLSLDKIDHLELLKFLTHSKSKTIIIQIQDLLGLGSEARFNYPGTVSDKNWTWKLEQDDWQKIDWTTLSKLTKESSRTICG
jgi:4-alpha-glucanotransferase